MTDNNVVEKIKKLFALANQSKNNSESEATAAMAKAQELLAKYNLDLATVQDSAKADDAPGSGPREEVQVKRSAMYKWQRKFWAALAEANFCFHWITEMQESCNVKSCRCNAPEWPRLHKVQRHVILGSVANVTTVHLMGEYVTDMIEKLQPYGAAGRLSNAANSWREGCAARLIERINEKATRMKKEGVKVDGVQCTALAVQDVHEKEYVANYDARYGKGAYARMKASQAEWDVKYEERKKKAAEEMATMLAGETPAQRQRREAKESKMAAKQAARDAAWWDRYYARSEREAARKDVAAYARGFKKANDINLDSQVANKKQDSLN